MTVTEKIAVSYNAVVDDIEQLTIINILMDDFLGKYGPKYLASDEYTPKPKNERTFFKKELKSVEKAAEAARKEDEEKAEAEVEKTVEIIAEYLQKGLDITSEDLEIDSREYIEDEDAEDLGKESEVNTTETVPDEEVKVDTTTTEVKDSASVETETSNFEVDVNESETEFEPEKPEEPFIVLQKGFILKRYDRNLISQALRNRDITSFKHYIERFKVEGGIEARDISMFDFHERKDMDGDSYLSVMNDRLIVYYNKDDQIDVIIDNILCSNKKYNIKSICGDLGFGQSEIKKEKNLCTVAISVDQGYTLLSYNPDPDSPMKKIAIIPYNTRAVDDHENGKNFSEFIIRKLCMTR